MNIEARLRERVGPAAGRLHTGRSRNDQVATDLLLYLRDAARAAERGLHELRGRVLLERPREHLDTVLPGYTHLQRAQPVRLAHHWLAFVEMFGRDAERFRDLRARIALLSPLGAGALAGTTLPLDRDATAGRSASTAPSSQQHGRRGVARRRARVPGRLPRSPWCISRASPRSWCSGRAPSSASSSSPTPTRRARA